MILAVLLASLLVSRSITLHDGPIPVSAAFERKEAMGEAAFASAVDAALSQLDAQSEASGRCPSPAEAAAAAEFKLVQLTRDPEAFARTQTAVDAALERQADLRALYLGGGQVAAPYGLVGRMVAKAKAEPNARLAELYRRMAADQFSRINSVALKRFFGPGVHTTWEAGLDDVGLAYVATVLESRWCAQEVANTAWLKADLRAHGWYRISIYGADADRAAWSMVMHARHDLAFRQEALAMLEPLWRSGETRGENYANLYDSLALDKGRPPRFAPEGACTGLGIWTPGPLEDPATTDAWRAKAGMPPLSEEIATRARLCTR